VSPIDVETAAPEGRMSAPFRRWLAILVGIAAIAVPVLTFVEADAGRKEEQAFVNGSRGALDIFVRIAAKSPREQFAFDALRESVRVGAEGFSRLATAEPGLSTDYAIALERAARQSEGRIRRVAEVMSALPNEESDLDPTTVEALGSTQAELDELVEAQGAAIDAADTYGTRQERGMFALGLAAIAAALLGLAGLMGSTRAGRTALVSAGAALLVSLVAGASGYL